MTSAQVPAVGRIVHYLSRGSADGVFAPECRAAIITADAGELGLSLAVLSPSGLFMDAGLSEGTTGGTWHWPGRDGDCSGALAATQNSSTDPCPACGGETACPCETAS